MTAVFVVVLAFLRKSQYLQTVLSAHSKYLPHYSKCLPILFYTTQYKNIKPFKLVGKVKGKVLSRTGHEGPEGEQGYSSTLSLTLALDKGGW